MKTIKKLALTLLAVFTLACGVAGLATIKTQKVYADGTLYANVNVGKDISLKLTATIDGATSASATFNWEGNEADGTEKAEAYVDTVIGEKSENGTFVFTYKGIGAQYLGKTVAVTVKYDTENKTEVVYTEKTLSVKDVLTAYRNSSAIALGISPAAFEEIKTLSADILNYGAAAQEYMKVDTSAPVNDGLTSSDYTTVDFTKLEGELPAKGDLNFVMGVRFDYNIQPMAKFTSAAENLTAKINGTEAEIEALGENQYKIIYKDFDILSVDEAYTFEVSADGEKIGSATCSLAALAKNYNMAILRAAYAYGTAVSNYLEAKKTLVIEAESDYVVRKKADGTGLTIATENDISFLKDLNGNANATISFSVGADEDCVATLKATLRMMPWAFELSKYVGVEVNGESITPKYNLQKDPNEAHTKPAECDFTTIEIGDITLKKGFNTIKFIENYQGTNSQFPDFDKIEITAETALREYLHISVIEAESDCVSVKQADEPKWGGVTTNGTTDGKGRLKVENENAGASFTFNITSDAESEFILFAYITPKSFDYYLHNDYALMVNDGDITYETAMIATPGNGVEYDGAWAKYFVRVKVATIKLKAGTNTITFTAKNTAGLIMDKIELISTSATVTGVAQA